MTGFFALDDYAFFGGYSSGRGARSTRAGVSALHWPIYVITILDLTRRPGIGLRWVLVCEVFVMTDDTITGQTVTDDAVTVSPGAQFRTAMILALVADVLQIAVFPLFVAGAASPADDVLDFGIGALMIHLLGWHWEFLPSFVAKLVPGVDLVPFWTLAVANVYRKSKRIAVSAEEKRRPELEDGRRG
jgi:hypothetical protein